MVHTCVKQFDVTGNVNVVLLLCMMMQAAASPICLFLDSHLNSPLAYASKGFVISKWPIGHLYAWRIKFMTHQWNPKVTSWWVETACILILDMREEGRHASNWWCLRLLLVRTLGCLPPAVIVLQVNTNQLFYNCEWYTVINWQLVLGTVRNNGASNHAPHNISYYMSSKW